MKILKHPTLIRRHLDARLKEFKAQGPFVAASLVAFRRKCGRPGCHCQSGEGHLAHHLTYKVKGKTRSVYVSQDPFVAASLVAFRRKCGRPGCHCQSGEGHLAHHLTYKVKGKTRSVYVPQ